ncbi:Calcipressin [Absidia repens]|uniref:Calcipressin n=1 Tax=Absidia repens TaxID=90262 RepID=A0A1X2J2J8_9FUNG|nr:Calcipressin [Absidia repens]
MPNSIATNTLLIPNIPPSFFVGDQALQYLRKECARYGEVHQFIPMKGFGRVMVIYVDTTCAITAKDAVDEAKIYWIEIKDNDTKRARILGIDHGDDDIAELCRNIRETSSIPYSEKYIRVYFGQHNPINPDPATLSLQVPDLGKNLLISPPGDPCHHWESRAESPPNKAILASDLLRALTTVDGDDDVDMDGIDDFKLDEGPVVPTGSTNDNVTYSASSPLSSPFSSPTLISTHSDTPTLQISFDHEHLPTIKIQDMDGSLLAQHQQKINRPKPSATARPPIRT